MAPLPADVNRLLKITCSRNSTHIAIKWCLMVYDCISLRCFDPLSMEFGEKRVKRGSRGAQNICSCFAAIFHSPAYAHVCGGTSLCLFFSQFSTWQQNLRFCGVSARARARAKRIELKIPTLCASRAALAFAFACALLGKIPTTARHQRKEPAVSCERRIHRFFIRAIIQVLHEAPATEIATTICVPYSGYIPCFIHNEHRMRDRKPERAMNNTIERRTKPRPKRTYKITRTIVQRI